jgi:hypothetical protein
MIIVASKAVSSVTLELFAGVSAVLTEGFTLSAALENDGITPAAWARAGLGWNRKLAAAGGGAPLSIEFRALLGQAQDWLGGRLVPVDDDPGAWLDLLSALGLSPDPTPVLAQLGVKAREVARSQRRWAERMAEDATVRGRVAALAGEKRKPVSGITVVAPVLKPFPWTSAFRPSLAGQTFSRPAGNKDLGLPLDQYAALEAELNVRPADRGRILANHRLDDHGLATIEAAWGRRFEADPAVARDFRLLESLSQVRFRAEAGGAEGAALASPLTERADSVRIMSEPTVVPTVQRFPLAATAEVSLDAIGIKPLPFVSGQPTADRTETEARSAVAQSWAVAEEQLGAVRGTAELTPEMLAVLFRRAGVPSFIGGAARASVAGSDGGPRGQASTTGTVDVSLASLGIAPLPFGPLRTPAASVSPTAYKRAPAPEHQEARPAGETREASAEDVRAAVAAIPFAPRLAAPPRQARARPAIGRRGAHRSGDLHPALRLGAPAQCAQPHRGARRRVRRAGRTARISPARRAARRGHRGGRQEHVRACQAGAASPRTARRRAARP